MPELKVFVHAVGSEPSVSLPENGLSSLAGVKYLHLRRDDRSGVADVFQVANIPRKGASGVDVYLQPGQLGLTYDQRIAARVSPATSWAYRRSQLKTPTGFLVLATLVTTIAGAGIDGAIAIGKAGTILINCSIATLSLVTAVSMISKILAALFAFLLALWFKK